MRVVLLFLLSIIFSCTTEVSNEDFITITIEDSHYIEEVDFISDTTFILLEFCEDCIIGDISKIVKVKEGFIISDKVISKRIFMFDNEGKFLFPIGESGDGLGNYILPFDFSVVPDSNRIAVLDNNQSKILYYSISDGSFIEEWKINFQPESLFFLDSLNVAIHLDGNYAENEMDYLGVILDLSANEIKERNVWDYGKTDQFKPYGDFFKGSEGVVFTKALNDTVYEVDLDGFRPKYFVDFGNDAVPVSLKSKPFSEMFEQMRKLTPSHHNGNFIENDRFLFYLWWGSDDKAKFSFFEKAKNVNYVLNADQIIFKHPFYVDNHLMYSYLNNRDLDSFVGASDNLKTDNQTIVKVTFK